MKKLILFDFDGVIAASFDAYFFHVKKWMDENGYDFIKEEKDFLNLFHDNLYASYIKAGVKEDDLAACFEYLRENIDYSKIPIYNDIEEMLKNLSKKVHVGIVSSNRKDQIGLVMKANNIDQYFDVVFGYEDHASKVEKLKMALLHFNVDPKDALYVVDTVGDIKESKEAGVPVAGVGWGWHTYEELKQHNPDHFVKLPKDVLSFFC